MAHVTILRQLFRRRYFEPVNRCRQMSCAVCAQWMRLISVGSLYVSNGSRLEIAASGSNFLSTYKRLKFSRLQIKLNPNIDNTMELGKSLALVTPK
jgi:hypothetical protein